MRKEWGVLGLQFLDFGQLLEPHIIKGILGRLMEQDFSLMFLAKFLGLTGLPIGHIGVAGLGIVDDVGLQDSDLRHAFLLCLDFGG